MADPRNTSQHGYGWQHRRLRALLLPKAWGKPCPFCTKPMLRGQLLDLDHVTPLALGGHARDGVRISHARCNRSAGSRLRHELRAETQQPPQPERHSRQW